MARGFGIEQEQGAEDERQRGGLEFDASLVVAGVNSFIPSPAPELAPEHRQHLLPDRAVESLTQLDTEGARLGHEVGEAIVGQVRRREKAEERAIVRRQCVGVEFEVAGDRGARHRVGLEQPQPRPGGKYPIANALDDALVEQYALGRTTALIELRQRRGVRQGQHHPYWPPGVTKEIASRTPALDLVSEAGQDLAPLTRHSARQFGELTPASGVS